MDSSDSPNRPLAGKVALLTGATSREGRAFALALARAGTSLFLIGRREEGLRDLAAAAASAGSDCAYHVADLRTIPAIYDLVDVLLSRFKRLDILIHNARASLEAPMEDLKRSEIAEMIETNLAAPIYLTQAALGALRRSAPSDIVFVVSGDGLRGLAHRTGFCAAEHGVAGFSRALAQELADDGIRVTTVSVEPAQDDRRGDSVGAPAETASGPSGAVAALLEALTSPARAMPGEIVPRPGGF